MNIHEVMDASKRTIYGKVEITYTDPFIDEDIVASASETGRFTYAEQVADNITVAPYKWFSLHENVLNGSYHPLSGTQDPSVGWWGTTLSDARGNFASPITLTIQFDSRLVQNLQVVGDSQLNCYPVNFTIKLYNSVNTVLYTETVTGNASYLWYKDITDVQNVAKMELSITTISKSNHVAKVVELFTAVVETYEADQVEAVELLEELEFQSGTIMLGALSSNEIDITLDNTDKRFSPGNVLSPLNGLLKRNRRIRAWLGAVVNGTTQWYSLGVFWTTMWKVTDQAIVVALTARDRLELMRATQFTTSTVYVNYTLYDLFQLVLLDSGLIASQFTIDSSLSSITIPYAWFDKMSHKDALQRLAGCTLVNVYCNRDGLVVVKDVTPTVDIIYSFDDNKNLYGKDFPLAWAELANVVEVAAMKWDSESLSVVYDDEEAFTVPATSVLTKTFLFTYVPVTNMQSPVITAGAHIIVQSYTAYAWGAVVTFQNTYTVDEQVTKVTIQGSKLVNIGLTVVVTQDAQSIKDLGQIKTSLQHDFIQTTSRAQVLATEIINRSKSSRLNVALKSRGNIALKLGDKVTAPAQTEGKTLQYMVSRQYIKWMGFLEADVDGKAII